MYIMNLGSASVKVTKHNVMQIRGGLGALRSWSRWNIFKICSKQILAGGFKDIFYVHPENWGNDPI